MKKLDPQQIEKMEALWTELLTKSPSPEVLWDIMRNNEHLRDRAWQEYLKTTPSRRELTGLIEKAYWRHLRDYPARQLIERFLDVETLEILLNISNQLVAEAFEKLHADAGADTKNKKNCLRFIITRSPDMTLCEKAAADLLEAEPAHEDLEHIAFKCWSTASGKKASQLLVHQFELDDKTLARMIRSVPELADEIWKKHRAHMGARALVQMFEVQPPPVCGLEAAKTLLSMNDDFITLFAIAKRIPFLREPAWQKLSRLDLSESELVSLQREIPEYKDWAGVQLAQLHNRELARGRTPELIAKEIWQVQVGAIA